jgi:GTPase SAR1 family protein
MMLWDIAGAEDHFSVPVHYIKGSAGYLLVMDGTRRESIEAGLELIKLVNDNLGDIPYVPVINKCDLDWDLSDDDISSALGMELGEWLKSSAKTGENVETAFTRLAELTL